MEIKTDFSCEDGCYVRIKNKVEHCLIKKIKIEVIESETSIKYVATPSDGKNYTIPEDKFFTTKKELINSL